MLALKKMDRQSATQNDTEGTFMQPQGFAVIANENAGDLLRISGISTLKAVTRS